MRTLTERQCRKVLTAHGLPLDPQQWTPEQTAAATQVLQAAQEEKDLRLTLEAIGKRSPAIRRLIEQG